MKNLYLQSILLFCLVGFFAFSCAPKYGAYFPVKQYESNPDRPDEKKLLASEKPTYKPETATVSKEEEKLLESIDASELPVNDKRLEAKGDRGILKVVKKSEKNAVMTEREELILDALQIRLKEMSKGEKKALKKEIRQLAKAQKKETVKELKTFNEEKNSLADSLETINDVEEPSTNTLLLVILAVLLPPLAVGLHEGALNGTFWLNLILTLIFYVPGLIHALIVILRED